MVSVFVLPIEWRLLLLTAVTPYLAVYLALEPSGRRRAYNRVGDYSCGVYIYGAPIQMILLATLGSTPSVLSNFVCTAVITLVLAALSWHLLRKQGASSDSRLTWSMRRCGRAAARALSH